MQTMNFALKNGSDIEALIEGLKSSDWNRESVEEAFSNVLDSTKPNLSLLFLAQVLVNIEKKLNEAASGHWTYWESGHSHEDFLKKSYSLDLIHLKKIRCVTTTKKSEPFITFECRKTVAFTLLIEFVFNQNKFLIIRDNELYPFRVFLHEDAIVSIFKDLGRKNPEMVYDTIDFDLEFFESLQSVFKFMSVNARVNIADRFRKSLNACKLTKILQI